MTSQTVMSPMKRTISMMSWKVNSLKSLYSRFTPPLMWMQQWCLMFLIWERYLRLQEKVRGRGRISAMIRWIKGKKMTLRILIWGIRASHSLAKSNRSRKKCSYSKANNNFQKSIRWKKPKRKLMIFSLNSKSMLMWQF